MLSLCFVDNLGLNVTFDTIRNLVDGNRPIDLMFTFQVNDLTRNVHAAMTSSEGERFDAFFGSGDWRDVVRRFDRGERRARTSLQLWRISTVSSWAESVMDRWPNFGG